MVMLTNICAIPTVSQLNGVTELKQLNNVSGVSIVDESTEDAASKTEEIQESQINSIDNEETTSTVTNASNDHETLKDNTTKKAQSEQKKSEDEPSMTQTSTSKKVEQEPKPKSNTVVKNVPSGHSFKSYTNYKLLNRNSPQGRLQQLAYSDENGLRKIGEYYCVALGSYYGTNIGDCYIVTLSTGKSFKMTLCDLKANRHTDSNNQYTTANGCITEFYVDYSCFNRSAKSAGDVSVLPGLSGSIVSIEKIPGVNAFNF